MALVLIEEILMGLDDIKTSLDEAVTTLDLLMQDLHPDIGYDLQNVLEQDFLTPLQSRRTALNTLMEAIADASEN